MCLNFISAPGSTPFRSAHQSVADGAEAGTAVGASVPAAIAGRHARLGSATTRPAGIPWRCPTARDPTAASSHSPNSRVACSSMVEPQPQTPPPRPTSWYISRPCVEARAAPPRPLDHVRQLLVAARQRTLEHRGAQVVQRQPDLLGRHRPAHVRLLRVELFAASHPLPLERRVRLGHEVRHAHVHRLKRPPPVAPFGRSRAPGCRDRRSPAPRRASRAAGRS